MGSLLLCRVKYSFCRNNYSEVIGYVQGPRDRKFRVQDAHKVFLHNFRCYISVWLYKSNFFREEVGKEVVPHVRSM